MSMPNVSTQTSLSSSNLDVASGRKLVPVARQVCDVVAAHEPATSRSAATPAPWRAHRIRAWREGQGPSAAGCRAARGGVARLRREALTERRAALRRQVSVSTPTVQ
jgi:hypothetical protein